MEDGTIITLADRGATFSRWRIAFQDLSDQEANTLKTFFAATQGNLQPFLFADPTTNLLLSPEDLSNGAWETRGLLFDWAVVDPFGSCRASRTHNNTSSDCAVAQNTLLPGLVQSCFSVYLRSEAATTVTLSRTAGNQANSMSVSLAGTWQRFYLAGLFPNTTDASRFAITIPLGTQVEIFGPQLEVQLTPSAYVTGTERNSGICTVARFDMKRIDVIATGPNRNACVVSVRCNFPGGE